MANYDKCVVAFLEGSSGIAFDKEHDPQVKYSAWVVLEAYIFYVVTLPYSFLLNLIQSILSGSKTINRINFASIAETTKKKDKIFT